MRQATSAEAQQGDAPGARSEYVNFAMVAEVMRHGPENRAQYDVLLALARRCDRHGNRTCYPGKELIAADARMSERAVRDAIKALERDGWLTITKVGRSHTYRLSEFTEAGPTRQRVHVAVDRSEPAKAAVKRHRQKPQPIPAETAGEYRQKLPPKNRRENHRNESLSLPTSVLVDTGRPDERDGFSFDDFWETYPHRLGARQGRHAAAKAWKAAIRTGADPSRIIEAASAYRKDRKVIDGYAKTPSNWLSECCYDDELEPSRDGYKAAQGSEASIRNIEAARAERLAQERLEDAERARRAESRRQHCERLNGVERMSAWQIAAE